MMSFGKDIDEKKVVGCAGTHAAKYVEDKMGSLCGVEPHEVDSILNTWQNASNAIPIAEAMVRSVCGELI